MNSEDNFRESLEKLLAQKEFPFAESNWDSARQVIDASREGKKRKPYVYVLSALLLLTTGVFCFYLFITGETTPETKLALKNKNTEQTTGVTNEPLENNPLENGKESEAKNTPLNEASRNELDAKVTAREIDTKPDVAGENKTNDRKALLKNTTRSETTNTNETVIIRDKKTKKQKNKLVREDVKAVSGNYKMQAKIELIREKEGSKKPAKKGNKAIIQPVKNMLNKNQSVAMEPASDPVKNVPKENMEKAPQELKPEIVLNSGVPVNNKKDSLGSEVMKQNAPIDVRTKDPVSENSTSGEKVDTASSIVMDTKASKAYSHILSIEGGINYFIGWKTPGKKDARGLNPLIGINYSTYISKKVIALVGVNYYSIANLAYSSITSKNVSYGFGEKSEVIVITPTKLHYLGFPIKLNYVFNKNHSVGLGCNIGYLLNVNSQTEVYTENLNRASESVITKSKGYTQGFKTFDTQVAISYRRRIYKELFVNTEFNFGLTDVKDNTFFNSNVFERNMGIRCTLIYNIFKK